jgi:hypothetical protein
MHNIWTFLAASLVLERLPEMPYICGITLAKKTKNTLLKVWIRDSLDALLIKEVQGWLTHNVGRWYANCKFCPHKYILATIMNQKNATTTSLSNQQNGDMQQKRDWHNAAYRCSSVDYSINSCYNNAQNSDFHQMKVRIEKSRPQILVMSPMFSSSSTSSSPYVTSSMSSPHYSGGLSSSLSTTTTTTPQQLKGCMHPTPSPYHQHQQQQFYYSNMYCLDSPLGAVAAAGSAASMGSPAFIRPPPFVSTTPQGVPFSNYFNTFIFTSPNNNNSTQPSPPSAPMPPTFSHPLSYCSSFGSEPSDVMSPLLCQQLEWNNMTTTATDSCCSIVSSPVLQRESSSDFHHHHHVVSSPQMVISIKNSSSSSSSSATNSTVAAAAAVGLAADCNALSAPPTPTTSPYTHNPYRIEGMDLRSSAECCPSTSYIGESCSTIIIGGGTSTTDCHQTPPTISHQANASSTSNGLSGSASTEFDPNGNEYEFLG